MIDKSLTSHRLLSCMHPSGMKTCIRKHRIHFHLVLQAAKTTSAWLITSGFNMGVMKAVGMAVNEGQTFQYDKDRMTHVLRCIGIAPWGYVKGRNYLESEDGQVRISAQ